MKLRLSAASTILLLCGIVPTSAAEFEGWWARNPAQCQAPQRHLDSGGALQIQSFGMSSRGLYCSFEAVIGTSRSEIDTLCTTRDGVRKRLTVSLIAGDRKLILRRAGAQEDLVYVRCARASAQSAGTRNRSLAVKLEDAGEKLLDSGQPQKAEEQFAKAIQAEPDYASAWNNRGFARRLQRRYAEAIADYDEAIRLEPGTAIYLSNRGVALDGMDRIDASLKDFEAALAIDPDLQMALNGRGSALRQLGRAAQAVPDLEKAIRINPNYAVALNNLALAYRDLGDRKKAAATFTRAISAEPGTTYALRERGKIHLDDQRYHEAVADLTKVLGIDPNDRQALNSRGIAYLRLCEFAKALVDFDEALRRDGAFVYARWGRGLALEGLGSHRAALDALDRAASDDAGVAKRSDFSADRERIASGLRGIVQASVGGCRTR